MLLPNNNLTVQKSIRKNYAEPPRCKTLIDIDRVFVCNSLPSSHDNPYVRLLYAIPCIPCTAVKFSGQRKFHGISAETTRQQSQIMSQRNVYQTSLVHRPIFDLNTSITLAVLQYDYLQGKGLFLSGHTTVVSQEQRHFLMYIPTKAARRSSECARLTSDHLT